MAMWIFARLMGIECKWLLLLPLYHSTYVGLIANAYSREQKLDNMDYSTHEAVFTFICYVLTYLHVRLNNQYTLVVLAMFVAIKVLLRFIENTCVYKMYYKHYILCALLGTVPGISLLFALQAQKRVALL